MRGPISSLSWKAKITSGQPGRHKVRCEPVVFDLLLSFQPILSKAAKTRLALVAGQLLMPQQKEY
jgi:hypothetical protein